MLTSSKFAALEQCPARWERVFCVIAVSLYNAIPFLVGDQPDGAESLNPVKALVSMSTQGDPTKQLLLLGLYVSFLFVTLRTTRWQTWLFLGLPLILLSGWGSMSALWSFDPGITLRRSIALFGTVILGTYMGLRFDLRAMLQLMCWVTAIVLVWSIVVAVVWPNLGLDFEGRLRGVTAHKNGISGFASISFLVLITQLTMVRQDGWLMTLRDLGLIGLCVICMVWSESAAAIPVLLLAVPLLPITSILRNADRSVTAAIPLLIGIGVVLVVLAADNYDSLAQMLGKNTDLSGRTSVWEYAIKMFLEKPWLGYGFGTFWEGFNSPGGVFWSVTGLGVPHAHNGYIQLALDTGAIGLSMFAACLFLLVYRLGWLMRYGNEPLIGWSVAFLVLFLVSNLSETRMWVGNQPFTELFVYIVVVTNLQVWRVLCQSPSDSPITGLTRFVRLPPERISSPAFDTL